ncbi:MAG: dihydroorotate dehydrogenase electron transfer subunit [Lachnospiraceae bacterium]|nr:dihydroorotate dehydrogenase electron transfer subunit [Lachnospiraceae bacterium]
MAKEKMTTEVLCQEKLAEGIYSLWLNAGKMAAEAVPGQFISIYSSDASRLLPRPISLCEIDSEGGRLRVVYRVAGAGTEEFSQLKQGDFVDILGPLGNGFPLKEAEGKRVLLIGGGIGIPPMLETAKALRGKAELTSVLGYRDSQLFLQTAFAACGAAEVATEDGSAGTKGNVLDAVREKGLTGDLIFACGPKPMLRALKAYAAETDIKCYLSLEERMACGIGACLACVCQSKDVDEHSHVHNKRICKEGPVFCAEEVELL